MSCSCSSALSSLLSRPWCHPVPETDRHCLAASSARLSPAPTHAPRPEFSVSITCRPRQAPRTTAAPELLPGLAAISNRRSRRYEEKSPRDEHRRRTAPAVVSFARPGAARFPQAEARSARVPSVSIVRSSAPSPPNFPTSAFAPFVVELFIARCFAWSPTDGQVCRVASSRRSTLPTSARLSEPDKARIPSAGPPLTLRVTDCLLRMLRPGVLERAPGLSPSPRIRNPTYRIEPGDSAHASRCLLSEGKIAWGLHPGASVEHGQAPLDASGSTSRPWRMVGRPLSPIGSRVYRVVFAQLSQRQDVPRHRRLGFALTRMKLRRKGFPRKGEAGFDGRFRWPFPSI